MKKARQRAAGGGRKPQGPIGGKLSNFSTRITPETRAALDEESKLSGLSVSQVAEKMLTFAIGTARDNRRADPSRGFLLLVRKLIQECNLTLPNGRQMTWNDDAFVFDALSVAMSLLLKQLRPKASSTLRKELSADALPEVYREILSSPEEYGKWAFLQVWDEALNVSVPSNHSAQKGLTYDDLTDWLRIGEDMQRVRRDLKLGGKKQ